MRTGPGEAREQGRGKVPYLGGKTRGAESKNYSAASVYKVDWGPRGLPQQTLTKHLRWLLGIVGLGASLLRQGSRDSEGAGRSVPVPTACTVPASCVQSFSLTLKRSRLAPLSWPAGRESRGKQHLPFLSERSRTPCSKTGWASVQATRTAAPGKEQRQNPGH